MFDAIMSCVVCICSLQVMEEKGQPHLKIFKLQCIVGDFITEAEGPSKKDAKRNAAELMLPNLKGLPPVPPKVCWRTFHLVYLMSSQQQLGTMKTKCSKNLTCNNIFFSRTNIRYLIYFFVLS